MRLRLVHNSITYTEFICTKLLSSLSPSHIILMDNVPFHKNSNVRQAIESAGHIYLHLPTYSPFLNAAEWVFGHVKSHIHCQDLQNQQTLVMVIGNDMANITV